jgi:hypothetical protein
MVATESFDMPTMARTLGISVNVVRNFVARGITWHRADEVAVRCGYLPWEVWPDWADADPAQWMGPSCPEGHGYDFLIPSDSGQGENCTACNPQIQSPNPARMNAA